MVLRDSKIHMLFKKENKDVYIVALRDESKTLIGYYEKHEYYSAICDKQEVRYEELF